MDVLSVLFCRSVFIRHHRGGGGGTCASNASSGTCASNVLDLYYFTILIWKWFSGFGTIYRFFFVCFFAHINILSVINLLEVLTKCNCPVPLKSTMMDFEIQFVIFCLGTCYFVSVSAEHFNISPLKVNTYLQFNFKHYY